MKNRIFVLVGLMFVSCLIYAQGTLVATLRKSDGTVSAYYGTNSLVDAHAAATDGDVITLSSGTFNSVKITKAITLRGAGMELNTLTNTEPTVIVGYLEIEIDENATHNLIFEGLFVNCNMNAINLSNAVFMKSKFNYIYGNYKTTQFIHCKIGTLSIYSNSSVACVNCIVRGARNGGTDNSSFEFFNCMISRRVGSNSNYTDIVCSIFKNCVIITFGDSGRRMIDESCTVYNCVGHQDYMTDMFSRIPNSTNVYISDLGQIFKNYNGAENVENESYENFELTEEAQSKYLGDDGTQVGIYGGFYPYNPTTTAPQIKKFDVARKSTVDGKLQVDIEVSAASVEPEL